MGAPKQKWTSEEEAALKAGVVKHGAGKWRTILKDPEYSSILSLHSNVDLKDKWRNMSVTANGWGSREKARMALRRSQHTYRSDEESSECPDLDSDDDEESADAKPTISNGMLQIASPKQSISRLENLIIEAITSLKEPSGSNKTNIAMYIEDQYNTPPNLYADFFMCRLENLIIEAITSLKEPSGSNKTNIAMYIEVNRKYRIAPSAVFSQARRNSGTPVQEGRHKESVRVEKDDIRNLMKSQIDAELAKMRTMSVQEAAAAAARAVAEAEAAMAEAEEAAKEAEAAEADADAAQAFAEAAMTTLKNRYTTNLMVHG